MKTLLFVRLALLSSALAGAFTNPQLAMVSLTAFAGTQIIERKFQTTTQAAPLPINTSVFDQWRTEVDDRLTAQHTHLEKLDTYLQNLGQIPATAQDMFALVHQLQLKISDIETSFQAIGSTFTQELEQFRTGEEKLLQRLRQALQETNSGLELIFNRDESLKHFNRALSDVRKKLRIVNPWVRQQRFSYLIEKSESGRPSIRQLLEKNKQISLGWGYFSDFRCEDKVRKSYDGLPDLIKLRQDFPNHLELKCFDTHEKYIIVDGRWAMLGSHNFLNSYGQSNQREIGVIITDHQAVQKMINRYDAIKHNSSSENRFLKVIYPQHLAQTDEPPTNPTIL